MNLSSGDTPSRGKLFETTIPLLRTVAGFLVLNINFCYSWRAICSYLIPWATYFEEKSFRCMMDSAKEPLFPCLLVTAFNLQVVNLHVRSLLHILEANCSFVLFSIAFFFIHTPKRQQVFLSLCQNLGCYHLCFICQRESRIFVKSCFLLMSFLLSLSNLDSKYPDNVPESGWSHKIWVSWTDSWGKSHRGKV